VPNDPLWAVLWNRVCAFDAEQRQLWTIGLTERIGVASTGCMPALQDKFAAD
jgi:hypothetical protein